MKFCLANNFSKPTSLSFSLKLFVETSNHKAAIHRSHVFFFKLTQLTKSPYLLKIISVNIFWVVTMKATVHFNTAYIKVYEANYEN